MGVAQCQADIGAQDAYKVIWHVIQWRLEEYAKRDGTPMPGVTELTQEQIRKLRRTFPEHLREQVAPTPAEVIEAANEKSVIEA